MTIESTFAEDIPDLKAEPTEIINVDNMKPDDTMIRTFELQNNGTRDMHQVYLDTEYTVDDAEEDITEDFG
ncbi:TasA family protein [Virgibacillus sp. YIM 98842]|uniref:TasA family protein n=1 Tax=Virgibacillus sp. YIM 98842 TaxID=2663533 RepID=UPI0023E45BB8|nr:TasA family protein [Virgibacillus sp. YIM 98842]